MDYCGAGCTARLQARARVRAKALERATEQAMLLSHVHGGRGKEGCVGLGQLGVGLEREKERVFQRKILFHF